MAYYEQVYFDEIDLTGIEGVKIAECETDAIPEVILSSGKISRKDGLIFHNREYGGKKIHIRGHIGRSSRDDYLITRSELLKTLNKRTKVLQIPRSDQPTEYTATMTNTVFSDIGGGYANFDIEFTCTDPFGYERNTIYLLDAYNTTTASEDISLSETVRGDTDSPGIITVAFLSITDGTSKTVSVLSQAGENISVTRDWTTGEVVEFDMLNRTVQVNGINTDYTGVYWDFTPDDQNFTYEDDFTDRSADITAYYRPRIL